MVSGLLCNEGVGAREACGSTGGSVKISFTGSEGCERRGMKDNRIYRKKLLLIDSWEVGGKSQSSQPTRLSACGEIKQSSASSPCLVLHTHGLHHTFTHKHGA